MIQAAVKKEFSAERQLRARQQEQQLRQLVGGFGQDGGPGVAIDPSGISNAEVLDAVSALREEVAELRRSVASRPADNNSAAPDGLDAEEDPAVVLSEVAMMVRAIAKAKSELASIKHPMAGEDRMDDASNELDAIVSATEGATNTILESNERIEKEINKVASTHHDDDEVMALVDHVAEEVISIFEACNFQDITGQRVTKVVKTIHFIEERVRSMIDIWGVDAFADVPVPEAQDGNGSQQDLMNGPQLEGSAISQDEIDALFD